MGTEVGLGKREADVPQVVWGQFQWFAYFDPISNEARAISGSLGIYCVRPTLQEATDELRALVVDYIRTSWNPETKPENLHRSIPSEGWETHTNLFCERLLNHPEEHGPQWACGELVVTKNGEITSLDKNTNIRTNLD